MNGTRRAVGHAGTGVRVARFRTQGTYCTSEPRRTCLLPSSSTIFPAMSSPRVRLPDASNIPPSAATPDLKKTHVEAMLEKFVFYGIHSEESRAQVRTGIPEAQEKALYDRMVLEYNSNPRYPKGQFRSTKKYKREFWRKCEDVCYTKATTPGEHLLHLFTSCIAMQFISSVELPNDRVTRRMIGKSYEIIESWFDVNEPQSSKPDPVPPLETFDGAEMLKWVGHTFHDRVSNVNWCVEDALSSMNHGCYFVLRAADGTERKVSGEELARMVDGISVPSSSSLDL
ncbi:hypothetical protein BV25DRAFT_1821979 [Artomyces pyxidatus]|uniref:Uncharacterized protein n=1 Tax=Artomyces pyxidatus TaxID=48021 RepID=A0ACB8TAH3_9AGAM|nr:hypothetical protein BV25DRAFT_1821979 [Artomyces pyxidatus]